MDRRGFLRGALGTAVAPLAARLAPSFATLFFKDGPARWFGGSRVYPISGVSYILPAASAGQEIVIENRGAGELRIFPPTRETLTMQSDSGQELVDFVPVPEVGLDEAKALVDSWGDLNAPGLTSFRIHRVAETLRNEVTRLEAQRQTLQESITKEVTRRRATEVCYTAAADQVHAIRRSIGSVVRSLAKDPIRCKIFVGDDYTQQELLEDLRAMMEDPREPEAKPTENLP